MKAGVIIGHLKNVGNEGSIIRTAEAFGINNIMVLGGKQKYNSSEGAENHVLFNEFADTTKFIDHCLKNNQSIVCIENINNAKEITDIKKYPRNPIFVTGNEKTGIPKDILGNSKLNIKINQGCGYVNCLNTSIAMGIVLHDFYSKHITYRKKLWEESNPHDRKK